MRRICFFLSLMPFFLAACSSNPMKQSVSAAPVAPVVPATPATANSPAVAPVGASLSVLAAHLDPNSALSRNHSVYFDFDDAMVRSEYAPVIELHGRYLLQDSALRVIVQGNTDERGGSEYNLALGQRRAQAVKSALQIYGVPDSRVEAVSFGSERPVATGHDEAAWRQNRRADIVYPR